MDRNNHDLLAAFSTVLPLAGPATPPRVNPFQDQAPESRGEAEEPAPKDPDDELITGAGGAYL